MKSKKYHTLREAHEALVPHIHHPHVREALQSPKSGRKKGQGVVVPQANQNDPKRS